MKKIRIIFCLMLAAIVCQATATTFAYSLASQELTEYATANQYVSTLKDGTSTYSVTVQNKVNTMATEVFDSWVELSDQNKNVKLSAITVVPVTGNLAYSELNAPYKTNLSAIAAQYSNSKNILDYAVRYDFVSNDKQYSAMCFMGQDKENNTTATNISIFDPKSDVYITALYTILYPSVPAMIFNK